MKRVLIPGVILCGADVAQAPCGHRWRALSRRWKHWLKAWGLVEE
ncbi:hypothetical protein Q604_UNBC02262G0001, partial [human gut metagenome]